ncbi:MAG: HAD-IA family hydrolase [Bacteroidales bacterium]|nr:HAD-IA family hydrolase [Bacteroidales bacterium]
MIRLIIFDFDGTLGDTRANIVMTMRDTMRALGLEEPSEDAIAATIGIPLADGFAQLYPGMSLEETQHCAVTYRQIFEKNRKLLVPGLFPHVKETLALLRAQGYTLTVASSRMSSSLRGFLHDMGIEEYISYVLGVDNVEKAKPDPEPVLKTLRDLGMQPEETMVVGDMPVDILMGRRAGAKTCAVTYGNASLKDLDMAEPDFIIGQFSDLPVILTNSPDAMQVFSNPWI